MPRKARRCIVVYRAGGGQEQALRYNIENVFPNEKYLLAPLAGDGIWEKALNRLTLLSRILWSKDKVVLNSPDLALQFALFLCRRKYCLVVHSTEIFGPLRTRDKNQLIAELASRSRSRIVFVSREHIARSATAPSKASVWIPNFVPFPRATSAQSRVEDTDTPESGLQRLVFIGRLSPEKRPLLALEIATAIATKISRPLQLRFYGDGPDYPQVERACVAAERQSSKLQVVLCGHVSDPWMDLNSRTDTILCTSERECLPLALIEAVQNGYRVIATNVFTGPAEILSRGKLFSSEVPGLMRLQAAVLMPAHYRPPEIEQAKFDDPAISMMIELLASEERPGGGELFDRQSCQKSWSEVMAWL